jgi:geranylgeranyl diphosphate synthase type I
MSATPPAAHDPRTDFAARLGAYKQAIDVDLAAYAEHVATSTRQQYGPYAGLTTDTFLDMLQRGGKRIRGALTMVGYEMCGGTDRTMITRAASAIEMMHAYILMIDDIQDRSSLRRGKPTAHVQLASYHRKHKLQGDADHAGISLALDAAVGGMHAAQMLFAGLNVDADLRMKAVGIVNLTMLITAHGQTYDIMNELTPELDPQNIERAMEWKTAHYTFLNPLCVGMVLADAGCEKTDAIRQYALHAGLAFQITDDIIGVFGDESKSGKHVMDDIREGKRTLLTAYALDHAAPADRTVLREALGNPKLTQAQFERCRQIIENCGALDAARTRADNHVTQALAALDKNSYHWRSEGVDFLRDLAQELLKRRG